MTATTNAPQTLAPGAYWYVVPGKDPEICEKRAGEDFVRFTNGRRQTWAREDERFVGPLAMPVSPITEDEREAAARSISQANFGGTSRQAAYTAIQWAERRMTVGPAPEFI